MITVDISGFGRGYELACQLILAQALDYIKAHPNLDPQFHEYENVTGVLSEDNADAKALSQAALFEVPGGPSGAMHQFSLGHALYIRKHGREKWLEDGDSRDQLIEIPFESAEEMRDWLNVDANRKFTDEEWPKARLEGEYK